MKFSIIKYIIVLCICVSVTSCTIPLIAFADDNSNIAIEKPQISTEIEDDEIKNVPTFKNGYTAWNYAYNNLQNGKGYEVEFRYTGSGGLLGINYSKTSYTRAYFDGKDYMENQVNYSNNFAYGSNSCNLFGYFDGVAKTLHTKNVSGAETADPALMNGIFEDNATPHTYTLEGFIQKHHRDFRLFPYEVNKNTSVINYFRTDNNYYYVEYFLNPTKISEFYLDTMKNVLTADSLKYEGMTITCIISKKTGNYVWMSRKEAGSFIVTRGITVEIPAKVSTTYNFIKVNSEVEIINKF